MNTVTDKNETVAITPNASIASSSITVNPAELKEFKGGNTRRKNDEQAFNELCESIRNIGIIQKPIVRTNSEGELEIVVGHRRVSAAISNGLESIDVEHKELTDREAMEQHLCENTVRQDLDFVSQIQASKRWLSFFNGDRESAAKRLMWSVKKLNERLELVHCCDQVLDALDQGKIKAGHALILSILPEKIQIGTLKRVIDEKLTVAELKQRATKVQLPLGTAKFDKTDCNSCKHNSERQVGLFDLGDEQSSTCSFGTCYRNKTQAYLSDQKNKLEEKYGKVLFFSESNPADRRKVDTTTVGEEQFTSGCALCSKRISILDDRPAHEGTVIESQCIDVDCNDKCVAALAKAKKAKTKKIQKSIPKSESDNKGIINEADTETTSAPVETQETVEPVACQPSNVVIESHKRELVDFARNELKDNELFRLSLAVACVTSAHSKQRGFNNVGKITAELASTKTKKEILDELSKSITNFILTSDGADNANAFQFYELAFQSIDGLADKAVQEWQPSKENISSYTIEGLKQLCSGSGFAQAANEQAEDSFKTMHSAKKTDFIKSILGTKFNWQKYAPPVLLTLLKR
tara:strand:+ start:17094 stop:18836 length:1743 start_codon:yes stop_codon:yes gene_type:complete